MTDKIPTPEEIKKKKEAEMRQATMEMDPWKHRSAGMRCITCMYYVAKSKVDMPLPNVPFKVGRCRRHAPTMKGFPVVFETDWCGEHKLDENKLQ